jgi:hypothetical protein
VSKVNYQSYYLIEYVDEEGSTSEVELDLLTAATTAKRHAGKLFKVDTNLVADYEEDYIRFMELKNIFEPNTTMFDPDELRGNQAYNN